MQTKNHIERNAWNQEIEQERNSSRPTEAQTARSRIHRLCQRGTKETTAEVELEKGSKQPRTNGTVYLLSEMRRSRESIKNEERSTRQLNMGYEPEEIIQKSNTSVSFPYIHGQCNHDKCPPPHLPATLQSMRYVTPQATDQERRVAQRSLHDAQTRKQQPSRRDAAVTTQNARET